MGREESQQDCFTQPMTLDPQQLGTPGNLKEESQTHSQGIYPPLPDSLWLPEGFDFLSASL